MGGVEYYIYNGDLDPMKKTSWDKANWRARRLESCCKNKTKQNKPGCLYFISGVPLVLKDKNTPV